MLTPILCSPSPPRCNNVLYVRGIEDEEEGEMQEWEEKKDETDHFCNPSHCFIIIILAIKSSSAYFEGA